MQREALVAAVGADRLDKADGADGDEVLRAHAARLELPREEHHEAEIVLDEPAPRVLVAGLAGGCRLGLLLRRKGRRKNVAAADIVDGGQTAKLPQKGQNFVEFHAFLPFIR